MEDSFERRTYICGRFSRDKLEEAYQSEQKNEAWLLEAFISGREYAWLFSYDSSKYREQDRKNQHMPIADNFHVGNGDADAILMKQSNFALSTRAGFLFLVWYRPFTAFSSDYLPFHHFNIRATACNNCGPLRKLCYADSRLKPVLNKIFIDDLLDTSAGHSESSSLHQNVVVALLLFTKTPSAKYESFVNDEDPSAGTRGQFVVVTTYQLSREERDEQII